MIISTMTDTTLFCGMDFIQSKMLVEVLRSTNQDTYKKALEALNEDGFTDVTEADVQAFILSSAFALGQFTDKLMTLKKAQVKDFEEDRLPEGSMSKTVN